MEIWHWEIFKISGPENVAFQHREFCKFSTRLPSQQLPYHLPLPLYLTMYLCFLYTLTVTSCNCILLPTHVMAEMLLSLPLLPQRTFVCVYFPTTILSCTLPFTLPCTIYLTIYLTMYLTLCTLPCTNKAFWSEKSKQCHCQQDNKAFSLHGWLFRLLRKCFFDLVPSLRLEDACMRLEDACSVSRSLAWY